MKQCKKCGKISQDSDIFCGECGTNLEKNFTYICNRCGRLFDKGDAECPNCHIKPDIQLSNTATVSAKEIQDAASQKADELKEKAAVAATVVSGVASSFIKTASEKATEASQKATELAKTASEKTTETKDKVVTAVHNSTESMSKNKTSPTNNKLIIALIVAALLIGGMGSYILFGRTSNDKKLIAQSQQTAPATQVQKEKTPVKPVPPKEEKTSFIVGTNVNAREKASIDSAVVGTFTLGEKVVILADEPEWAKVKRADGKECYVFKKFLGDQADLDKRKAKYNIKSGPYPVFLNGDPNYILVDAQMGGAWYLIRNSVQRQESRKGPNEWDIACDVVSVGDADKGNTTVDKSHHYVFRFSEQYRFAGIVGDNGIRTFKYNGPRSETMVINGAGAMAYYIAMGKKWPEFGLGDDFYSGANL